MKWLRIIGIAILAVIGVIGLIGAVLLAFQIGTVAWVVLGVVLGMIGLGVLVFFFGKQMRRVVVAIWGRARRGARGIMAVTWRRIRRDSRKIFWILIGIATLSIFVAIYIFLPKRVVLPALGVILVTGGFFSWLVWYVLAPSNRFFTFVKEGTAKIIVRGDKFEKALIQWTGYTLNCDTWDVVSDGKTIKGKTWKEPRHRFGGLRFYGFWPLLDVGSYHLRWWDLQLTEEGREKIQFHEEDLDYVLLKPDVYWAKIEKAETKPPERIPADVEFLVTMRVTNPYKVIYAAPINWTENVMTRLSALFRSYVVGKELDRLLEVKGDPQAIWKELGKEDLIRKTLKKEWGIQIGKGEIQLRDVALSPEYQKVAAAREAEKMKAEGVEQRIKIEWGAIKEFGDLGKLVRTLEALEKSPLAASVTLHAIPGLPELLRGVFGKAPEEVSLREFQELRDAINKLSQRVEELSKQGGQEDKGSKGDKGGEGARNRRGYNRRKK